MKKIWGMVVVSLLLVAGLSAQSAYDSAKVKDVMHVNFESVQAAKKAIDATDAKAAVTAFNAIAEADKALLALDPPKGTKADWDKAFTALIASAKKGAEAATKKDWEGAKAALAEIRKAQGSGHGAFKG